MSSDYTLKPVKPPESPGAITEYAVLEENGAEVARLYRKETTKTGFRYGRCVGQVPCKAWFVRLHQDGRIYGRRTGFGGPRWSTRQAALDALPTLVSPEP